MNKLHRKLLKYIVVSLAFLLFIWLLGPYIAIDGKLPFDSLLARLVPTILVLFTWAGYGFIVLIHNKLSQINVSPVTNQFIQRTREVLKTVNRAKIPWVLVLGKEQSGKTTLLTNSEIDFSIKNASTVDWWVSDVGIFIDPIGDLCIPATDNTTNQQQWSHFIKYLHKKRGKQPFDAVILAVDFPTLINNEALNKLINQLVEQISYLSQYNLVTHITLVITQCDRIHGFKEFFADLGPEEREQGLGLNLIESQDIPLRELYQARFNAFVSRISERLIWRLHHEQNLLRRARIKDFPLQLERLGSAIEKFIHRLPLHSRIHINGIYFTSSLQSGNIINLLAEPLNQNFHLTETKATHHMTRQKPYFIHALLKKIIFDNRNQSSSQEKPWKTWAHYSVGLMILLIGVFFYHHAYRENVTVLNTVATNLSKSENNATWLTRLNSLEHAFNTLTQHSVEYYNCFGLGQAGDLEDQVHTTYRHIILTDFVLHLDQVLTKQIKIDMQQNQSGLYRSLQIYLMLLKPDHLKPQAIKTWFQQLWANELQNNNNDRKSLMTHLDYLLSLYGILHRVSWPANHQLIRKAQAMLQHQSLTDKILLVLNNEYGNKTAPLWTGKSIENLDASHLSIPVIYTVKNFKKIYEKQIPHIVNNLKDTNWIIGNTNNNLDSTQAANLIKKVRAIYLKNYIQEWQAALGSIKLDKPQHLAQALNEIRMFKNPKSPLWILLNTIIKNTIAPNVVPDTDGSNNLGGLIAFTHKNNSYKATKNVLDNLDSYLAKIVVSPSTTKAAYYAAVDRFKNNGSNDPIITLLQISKQLPTPISQWLQTIANTSWEIILSDSRQYLSTIWASKVVPEYNSHIINRFPIFKNSQQNIAINDFNHFFGPGGTMEIFFNNYLKPFVNTNQAYWTWRSLNSQHLTIPRKTLDMLIRASMIQKMFYGDNLASPTIRFKLAPISLSPNISSFSLNVGGQVTSFQPGIKKTNNLSWPGNNGSSVTMQFETISATSPSKTFTGPWAWLRVVSQSILESTNNPQEYQITFTLNKDKARYQLIADNPINPYQTQILSAFRAPNTL